MSHQKSPWFTIMKKETGAAFAQVIAAIKTPLGFFALVALIVDGAIGIIAFVAKVDPTFRGWLLLAALVILVVLILTVARIKWAGSTLTEGKNVTTDLEAKVASTSLALTEQLRSSGTKENGVNWAVAPDDRALAYERLRRKAAQRIAILGVGMTNLSEHELDSLREQAKCVNIDLLMMDPKYLKENPEFAKEVEKLFDIPYFADKAEKSFGRLSELCGSWNANPENGNKFRFKVYRHLPTVSMVMIDCETPEGELIFEMYLYKSGIRPRFHLRNTTNDNGLFDAFRAEYQKIWAGATSVVLLTRETASK